MLLGATSNPSLCKGAELRSPGHMPLALPCTQGAVRWGQNRHVHVHTRVGVPAAAASHLFTPADAPVIALAPHSRLAPRHDG